MAASQCQRILSRGIMLALMLAFFLCGPGNGRAAEQGQAAAPDGIAFDAAALARIKQHDTEGKLVDDPLAPGGQALEITGPFGLETYFQNLQPGLHRLSLAVASAPGVQTGPGLSFSFWNDSRATTPFRFNTLFNAPEFATGGQYTTVERTFLVNDMGSQYGLWLRDGWPGLRIASLQITPIPEKVFLIGVHSPRLVYGLKDTGSAVVTLHNATGAPRTVHLQVTVENGLAEVNTVFNNQVTVPAPAQPAQSYELTIPLPRLPEYGHVVSATLTQEGQKPEVAQDYFYVTDRPIHVGQYGIFFVGAAYDASEADANVVEFRNNYQTAAELDFWAPCEMSMLVPPPGKERWWSGQTLQKFSAPQLKTCIEKAHAQGIKALSYVDYSNVFGYRIFDFARRFPETLDWDTQNTNNIVWIGVDAKAASLTSPQRSEDDSRKDVKAAGCARTLHTSPAAMRWHADQLVASMNYFDWDGFRYDDCLDYGGKQVDMLGRRAPFNGWNLAAVIAYFRSRIEQVKPGAMLGHNSSPMRAGGDPIYGLGDEELNNMMDTAIMRNGGFALQEGWSNNLVNDRRMTWMDWRERNDLAGRAARRAGGDVCVITNMGGADHPAWWRAAVTALLLAGGNHIAYSRSGWAPYLALACRYSELLYGDGLRWLSPADTAKTVKVDAGGRPVWYEDWVRLLPVAPGKRLYLVHLFNPPDGALVNGSNAPLPLKDVRVTLTPPPGWKAGQSWLLGAERRTAPMDSAVMRERIYRETEQQGIPSREPLALVGGTATVPEVQCCGPGRLRMQPDPAKDNPPSDVKPLYPAPENPQISTLPSPHPQAGGDKAQPIAMPHRCYASRITRAVPGGQPLERGRPCSLPAKRHAFPRELWHGLWPGLDWRVGRCRGRCRITLRSRAPRAPRQTPLTCSTGAGAAARTIPDHAAIQRHASAGN